MTDIEKLRELLGSIKNGPDIVIDLEGIPTIKMSYLTNLSAFCNAIGPLLDRVEKMEASARRYEVIRHKMPPLALAKILRIEWTDMLPEQDIDEKIDELCDATLRGKGE